MFLHFAVLSKWVSGAFCAWWIFRLRRVGFSKRRLIHCCIWVGRRRCKQKHVKYRGLIQMRMNARVSFALRFSTPSRHFLSCRVQNANCCQYVGCEFKRNLLDLFMAQHSLQHLYEHMTESLIKCKDLTLGNETRRNARNELPFSLTGHSNLLSNMQQQQLCTKDLLNTLMQSIHVICQIVQVLYFFNAVGRTNGVAVLPLILTFFRWHAASMHKCRLVSLLFFLLCESFQISQFSHFFVLALCVEPLFGQDSDSNRLKKKDARSYLLNKNTQINVVLYKQYLIV